MLIYYCDGCNVRIPPADLESKAAVLIDETRALCAACAASRVPGKMDTGAIALVPPASSSSSKKSQKAIQPVTGSATIPLPAEARSTKGNVRSSHLAAIAPASDAANRRLTLIIVGVSGLVLISTCLIFALGSHGSTDTAAEKNVAVNSDAARPRSPQPSPPQPQTTRSGRTPDVVKPELARAASEEKAAIKKIPVTSPPPDKPATENAVPPAPPTPHAPATAEATPAPVTRPELPPGMQELDLGNATSVCKLLWSDFKGGGEYHGFGGKDKASKAIWGKKSTRHTLTATFDLKPDLYDSGTIVVWTLFEGKKPSAHILFLINAQEAYNGNDTATKGYTWTEQRYPLAAGLLKAGKNEFKISNLNDTSAEWEYWYMIHSVEILTKTRHAFPLVVSDAKRTAIRTSDSVDEMLKKDLDAAQKLDAALRLAKSVSDPDLELLVNVIEKAQSLNARALETLVKNPPPDDVQIEKPKLRGKIVRIADGKVYIQSQGVELAVETSALPQAVFMKALAFNESKSADAADKAAYLFGLGNTDAAQQLLSRLKKEDLPAWADYFDLRVAHKRLLKFESAVNEIETALKNAKTSVLPALESLKKDYPELIAANSERIHYLSSVAEQLAK